MSSIVGYLILNGSDASWIMKGPSIWIIGLTDSVRSWDDLQENTGKAPFHHWPILQGRGIGIGIHNSQRKRWIDKHNRLEAGCTMYIRWSSDWLQLALRWAYRNFFLVRILKFHRCFAFPIIRNFMLFPFTIYNTQFTQYTISVTSTETKGPTWQPRAASVAARPHGGWGCAPRRGWLGQVQVHSTISCVCCYSVRVASDSLWPPPTLRLTSLTLCQVEWIWQLLTSIKQVKME